MFTIGKKSILIVVTFLLFASSSLFSEEALDRKQKEEIVQEISNILNKSYVYPETGKKMSDVIASRLREGAYDKFTNPQEFAETVTNDLRSISKDKHLRFLYSPENVAELQRRQSQDETEAQRALAVQQERARRNNFGFRKVERLDGNIGYLDLRNFPSAELAGETIVAALNFLSNCDAIIIDLRKNGGGDTTGIQLISSYFFEQPTHLNDIYNREENSTEHYWTLPYVPGKKPAKADLYILTSNYTFSGAEEFSYNMKNLKRATLIGETTGGGAHPVNFLIVQNDFVISIPFARAINPITKTNWEGTGVTPDIESPSDDAFTKAYQMALEKLQAKAFPDQKKDIDWILAGLKAENPKIAESVLQKYAGVYQDRKITLENGSLYYQRRGPKFTLIPLTDTLFALEGDDYFRLEFVVKNGETTEVIGHYRDGRTEPSSRSN